MAAHAYRVVLHRISIASYALALFIGLLAPTPIHAYNKDTHRDITVYAYELMDFAGGVPADADIDANTRAFYQKLGAALQKLDALPAGLPNPRDSICADVNVIKRVGTSSPSWSNGGDFANMKIGLTPYPISLGYIVSKDCGIDAGWKPGQAYQSAHASESMHGGNVLGFWAGHPDDEHDDVHLGIHVSSVAGLSEFKQALETAGAVAVGTVWVPIKCFFSCVKGIFTLKPSNCKKCVENAVNDAKTASHDAVATVDGLFPTLDVYSGDITTGMVHHIDTKSASPPPGWLTPKIQYDDIGGLLSESAGPYGQPGDIEKLAIAGSDALGISLHYDKSNGPKRYEVNPGNDTHADSRKRTEAEWEYLTWPHTPFTPVDNLGWWGWNRFRNGEERTAKMLGWPLHAIGDASVPMHVTGTFAYGHRPYEDAVSGLKDAFFIDMGNRNSMPWTRAILQQAKLYYEDIVAWRQLHPEQGNNVPVRNLVTQVAMATLADSQASPGVFNDMLSNAYLVSAGASSRLYEDQQPFMRVQVIRAIAASIAFLLAASETLP